MGMSGDFAVAVEEGPTLVRVVPALGSPRRHDYFCRLIPVGRLGARKSLPVGTHLCVRPRPGGHTGPPLHEHNIICMRATWLTAFS